MWRRTHSASTPWDKHIYFVSSTSVLLVSIPPLHHIDFILREAVLPTLNSSFHLQKWAHDPGLAIEYIPTIWPR